MALQLFRNTFAGYPLDRSAERRRQGDWLQARMEAAETEVIALWNGSPLADAAGERLARLDVTLARRLAPDEERRLFLGASADDRAVFAIDLDGEADPSHGPLAGRGGFANLRDLAATLQPDEAALAATARALFEWRRRNLFCSVCGQPTRVAEAGWKRLCPACGTEHFPRTDPVVIMLPVRGEHCLLGRQASWAPGRFSALAGFMEPGESVEEACAREIVEECGLQTRAVHYHSSQPWPFPANLMIGLLAEVEEGEAAPDGHELEALRWLSREEACAALEGRLDISLPPPLAIAHQLIAHWARGG